jgi:hypothetical protein
LLKAVQTLGVETVDLPGERVFQGLIRLLHRDP